MTQAGEYVAQLREIDAQARAAMLGPLSALEALLDPVSGFDESKIDWDRPPITTKPANGTELENVVVEGRWVVEAEDVSLKNVRVNAVKLPTTGGSAGIVCTSSKVKRLWLEDVDIFIPTPNPRWQQAIMGHDYTAIRVTARGATDGFGWYNPTGGPLRIRQYDCATELAWFALDTTRTDRDETHNDPIQAHSPVIDAEVHGGDYNGGGKGTAGVMLNVTRVERLSIVQARFRGCRSALNLGPTKTVTDSAFTYNQIECPVTVFATDTAKAGLLVRGNTRPDGSPADVVTRS